MKFYQITNDITVVGYDDNDIDGINYAKSQGWKDVTNEYPQPPLPTPPSKDENKQTAITLLQQTDWATIPDVSNPDMANPYLANQSEFIAWRSQVRAIAVNPIDGNLEIFNQMPQEIWQSV